MNEVHSEFKTVTEKNPYQKNQASIIFAKVLPTLHSHKHQSSQVLSFPPRQCTPNTP